MRYFLEIAYNGIPYHGWQRQPNAYTVQEALEFSLKQLLGTEIETLAAGRTDTHVHAFRQYVHFDWEELLPEKFKYRLNCILPDSIAIHKVFQSRIPELNARKDAVSRTYRYCMHQAKNPFLNHQSYFIGNELDIAAMQNATNYLLKLNDFASFCKAHGNNKTTICTIYKAEWIYEPPLLFFIIKANRFLRGMVRAITGTLLEVGRNKLHPRQFEEIILKKNRKHAGKSIAPYGLYLWEVEYPDQALIEIQESRN